MDAGRLHFSVTEGESHRLRRTAEAAGRAEIRMPAGPRGFPEARGGESTSSGRILSQLRGAPASPASNLDLIFSDSLSHRWEEPRDCGGLLGPPQAQWLRTAEMYRLSGFRRPGVGDQVVRRAALPLTPAGGSFLAPASLLGVAIHPLVFLGP